MIRIAHITDPHLSPLPKMQSGEISVKRILGYLFWHRKRKAAHSAEVLEAVVRDLKAHAPSHIHVSGDLTNLALDSEYANARKWLETLGPSEQVSVIPGNHEFHRSGMYEAIVRHWLPYAAGDEVAQDLKQNLEFPFVRVLGNVALIGVNSAYKTPIFMATGRVDRAELSRLGGILRACKDRNLFRLVSIHHPPHEGATHWKRSLLNAQDFRDVITEHGAELVIHGHLHRPVRGVIDAADQAIPVRGAGSCSTLGDEHSSPAHYHIIEITRADGHWRATVNHRSLDPKTSEFHTVKQERLELGAARS